MPFRYQSGEELRKGDRIRYAGQPGSVQFVITEATGDPALDWYLQEYPGGGVMIDTEAYGPVFFNSIENEEDLEFVSRADDDA